MAAVHCHIPIKIRVNGAPSEETLRQLSAVVRRLVAGQVARGERELQHSSVGAAAGGAGAVERPPAPVPVTRPADEAPLEEYDAERDGPDGYALPSYDDLGRPVAVPVRRLTVPGRDWRVLRAVYVTMTVGSYLDYIEYVLSRNHPDPANGPALPGRVLYDDIATETRTVTVWLVETEVSATLGELLSAVEARAKTLAKLPADRRLAHTGSPFDGDRQVLATLDASGQVSQLPVLTRRNARRVRGSGLSLSLLHGSWILWTSLPLPLITPSTLLDIGPVEQASMRVADTEFLVDAEAFRTAYQVTWAEYVAEAGQRQVRVDLMPVRVKADITADAAIFLTRAAYEDAHPNPVVGPGTTPALELYRLDVDHPPDAVSRPGRTFAAHLPPLTPGRRPAHPAAGERVPPDTIIVLAVAFLPVDVDTLAGAQQRPLARVLAERLRRYLGRDVSDNQWKFTFYGWLGTTFTHSYVDVRPPGGTTFEFVLTELAASGDLGRLFDAVEGAGWQTLEMRLMLLCVPTTYDSHPRVARLRQRLQASALAARRNLYRETVDASNQGGIDLDKDPERRVSIGVPGRNVLGQVDSIYLFERTNKVLKAPAAARLRAAMEDVRRELVAEVASGRNSTSYTPDDFLREALGRAAERAHTSNADFEDQTLQRSLRITSVHRRDIHDLPSWDVTFQFVDRVSGGTAWSVVGDPVTETADDFEARLIYWRLGRAGEFYRNAALAITIVGGIAVAWEAGLIAALVQAAGGARMVLASIAISEAIYAVRIIFFDAKLTAEGVLVAALDGYLGALGFRVGALAAAPIGRAIGTATLRRVWGGLILQKVVAGAVGGGVGGGMELFAHDMIDVVVRDGSFHSAAGYARRIGLGAALGLLGEFVLSPVLHGIVRRGGATLTAAADLVAQLRRDGFSAQQFTAAAAEALGNLRRSLNGLVVEAAVDGYLAAFTERVEQMLQAWGTGVVARRVLQLAGARFTPQATAGVERFLAAAEQPASQEAARRLATTFAAHPQEAVYLLEVLASLDAASARRLMTGTFNTSEDLAAFLGRISRYTADQQRGILALLTEADLIQRPAGTSLTSGSPPGTPPGTGSESAAGVRDRQFAAALRIEARLARTEAARLRRDAQALLDDAVAISDANRRRSEVLFEQALAAERNAAEREALSESLTAGLDPRPAPRAVPDPHIAADQRALDAEVDRAFAQLEAGLGAGRPQAWIRLPAQRGLTPPQTDALTRTMFTSRSGNPVVFRVEGGVGTDQSRQFISVGSDGAVRISTAGRDLNVNVGSFERAIEFIVGHRPGAQLKVFEVEEGWLRALRGASTPEQGSAARLDAVHPETGAPLGPVRQAGSLSDVTGTARTVDTRQAADQLQIDSSLIRELQEFIVPGSGRVLEFVPRAVGGGAVR